MSWASSIETRSVAALLVVLGGLGCGDDAASSDGGSSEGGVGDAAAGSGAPIAGQGGSGGSGARDSGIADAGPNADGGDAGFVDPLACDDSLDCADQTEDRTVCHPLLRRCMQCVKNEDCEEGRDCVDHECRPYTTCVNSLDCELGEVCDAARERCVACVMDADCGEEEVCRNAACERVCNSDNDCTPLSKLCDLTAGHCVECVRASDCPDERHCLQGRCAADECEVDFAVCTEAHDAVLTCAEDGSGPMPPVACAAQQACGEAEGGSASCREWECTPGAVECAEAELVSCSADGLEVRQSEDCDADGKVCAQQACRTQACMPSSQFCDGNVLRVCAADGVTSQSLGACPGGQYCDPDAAACAVGVCAPSEPACNGAVATTCNAGGTGYEAGGDDCAADDDACVDGECEAVICSPEELSCGDDGDVQRCNATGTAWLAEQVCAPAQYCDGGVCLAQQCTPDALYCSGVELRHCNALGNDYEVEETCDASQQCDAEEEECVDVPDGGVSGTCTATACPACPITSGLCCIDGMCGCSLFFLPSQCTKAATDVPCTCE